MTNMMYVQILRNERNIADATFSMSVTAHRVQTTKEYHIKGSHCRSLKVDESSSSTQTSCCTQIPFTYSSSFEFVD